MTKASITLDVEPSIIENNVKIVKETQIEQELKSMFESIDTVPCKTVRPNPGFCVKTYTIPDNKKLFVNVCTTDAIPCPKDITSEELKRILNSDDPSNYRLPMSLGEGRSEPDKSGVAATVYDVAIHPNFFHKVTNDQLFRSFFLTVVFEGLQDKYQFEIDMSNYVILKNRKSVGTLQYHRIQIRDIQPALEDSKSPLIEEIKPTSKSFSKKDKIIYRLSRQPSTGDVKCLLAEYKIPPQINLSDLSLEAGEDRIVLGCQSLNQVIDLCLPYNINYKNICAQLNRNSDVMSVEMPVCVE